jgi:hypothetical protein
MNQLQMNPSPSNISKQIIAKAKSLGASLAGIADANPILTVPADHRQQLRAINKIVFLS